MVTTAPHKHPVIPLAHVHNFSLPIDLNDLAEAEKSVLHRAGMAKKSGIMADDNLKIAQHRDIFMLFFGGGAFYPQ